MLEQRLALNGDNAVQSACASAASVLEKAGRIPDALRLYARAHDDAKILHLCEQHGFTMIDEGRIDDVLEPLSVIPAELTSQHPAALTIRAIAESNASRDDIAESWYLLAIERADRPVLRATIAYRYGLELVRLGRRDGIDVLERHLGEALPQDLDASLRSTLATAYVLGERFGEARRMIASALALLDASSPKQTARQDTSSCRVGCAVHRGRRAREDAGHTSRKSRRRLRHVRRSGARVLGAIQHFLRRRRQSDAHTRNARSHLGLRTQGGQRADAVVRAAGQHRRLRRNGRPPESGRHSKSHRRARHRLRRTDDQ